MFTTINTQANLKKVFNTLLDYNNVKLTTKIVEHYSNEKTNLQVNLVSLINNLLVIINDTKDREAILSKLVNDSPIEDEKISYNKFIDIVLKSIEK